MTKFSKIYLKDLTWEKVKQTWVLWHENVDHSKEGEEGKATNGQLASKGKGMRKRNMSFSKKRHPKRYTHL